MNLNIPNFQIFFLLMLSISDVDLYIDLYLDMEVVGIRVMVGIAMGFIIYSKNRFQMGSTQPSSEQRNIIDHENHLVFYQTTDDPHLGRIKIYTSKKIPLCYILKYERAIMDSRKFNIFSKIEQNQAPPLITLYGFKISRVSCCQKITKQTIISYWEYYNFYLSDYLSKRSRHKCLFLESEIWHLVEVVCEGYNIFRKFGIYYQVDPSTLLLTPEGKLKLFWIHLQSQNSHLKYISYFQTKKLEKFYYSPEELQNIFQGERTVKIDFDKCNSFRLGMLILYCLILADPIYLCYNPSMSKINFTILKNLIVNKIVPSYSSVLVSMLTNLLKEDPKERKTLWEIYESYSKYFNPDNQLRVCGGKMPGDQGLPSQSSLNQRPVRLPQNLTNKQPSDASDTKTVKRPPNKI